MTIAAYPTALFMTQPEIDKHPNLRRLVAETGIDHVVNLAAIRGAGASLADALIAALKMIGAHIVFSYLAPPQVRTLHLVHELFLRRTCAL